MSSSKEPKLSLVFIFSSASVSLGARPSGALLSAVSAAARSIAAREMCMADREIWGNFAERAVVRPS